MRKLFLSLFFTFACLQPVLAQEPDADDLLKEGVTLHDAGKYEEAIAKYDAAYKADPKMTAALYEKSYSLASMGKNEEALALAKKIIKEYPHYPELAHVYMVAGNALDDLQRSEEALKIYDEGIQHFPTVNLFYYNKALSLGRLGKQEEAVANAQKDLLLKPTHASGHRFVASYYEYDENIVPALFANGVFLLLESQGNRAETAFAALQKQVKGNASVDSTKPNTININLFMPQKSKKKEDDFTTANLGISLAGSLNLSKELDSLAPKNDIEKMQRVMDIAIESTEKESKKKGFAWKFYVPFYAEMKKRNFVETFCYLCFRPSGNKDVTAWLAANEKEVENFSDWFQGYVFPKKVD